MIRRRREPNFDNLRRTILRQGPPGPVPFFDIIADPAMIEAVLGERFPLNLHRFLEETVRDFSADDVARLITSVDLYIRFCYEMGYDYVFMLAGPTYRRSFKSARDTADSANWPDGQRHWQDETSGPIRDWADFEAYPWPGPADLNTAILDYVGAHLPDGMKVAALMFGGVFEYASWLMGLEPFSYALRDDPSLVEAICRRVGDLTTAACARAAAVENVGIIILSDDLGFASGTLLSPATLRRYILPHYGRIARAVHDAGKLLVFHSCGNVYALMDELIDDIGIDAKHSFEDKILPVDDVYRRWGERVAVLGGVDMDLLGRGSEEQVRARTRQILDACGPPGTGYCLGTGNTPANYIPPRNYLAMLDEGRRWNQEHFGSG